jgi:hypothetical protein
VSPHDEANLRIPELANWDYGHLAENGRPQARMPTGVSRRHGF